jgi:hypothetical protein
MAYEAGWLSSWEFRLVNYGVWLSPILLVLLSRKSGVLICLCAVPILVVFAGHVYYLLQHYVYGTNVIRKSEWVWYLTTLMGTFSVGMVAFLLLLLIVKYIADFITRPFDEFGGKS